MGATTGTIINMISMKSIKNPATKIKINEVISLIKPVSKNTKITDNDLVDLLQYCELLSELELANA